MTKRPLQGAFLIPPALPVVLIGLGAVTREVVEAAREVLVIGAA